MTDASDAAPAPWRRERLAWVIPVGWACLVWSFFYDALQLPPRLPYGTVGLTLGGDVLPMLLVPLLVTALAKS